MSVILYPSLCASEPSLIGVADRYQPPLAPGRTRLATFFPLLRALIPESDRIETSDLDLLR
jgi:hypothetical protein